MLQHMVNHAAARPWFFVVNQGRSGIGVAYCRKAGLVNHARHDDGNRHGNAKTDETHAAAGYTGRQGTATQGAAQDGAHDRDLY